MPITTLEGRRLLALLRASDAPPLPEIREEDIEHLRKTLESWNTSTATIAIKDLEAAALGCLDDATRARFARMVAARDQIARILSVLEAVSARKGGDND